MNEPTLNWQEAAARLSAGEVGVIATDTLYGLVASAKHPRAVDSIYGLRQRDLDKPLITLIGSPDDMAWFGAQIDERTKELLDKVWPGPVSVIVPVTSEEHKYIHRGTNSIAFRMPNKPDLLNLLKTVGPIVAPSANIAGHDPAKTIEEAKSYFGPSVFYLDEGTVYGSASALVDIRTNPPKVLRPAPGFDVSVIN